VPTFAATATPVALRVTVLDVTFANYAGGLIGPETYRAVIAGTATVAASTHMEIDGVGVDGRYGCQVTGVVTRDRETVASQYSSSLCTPQMVFEKLTPGSYHYSVTLVAPSGEKKTASKAFSVVAQQMSVTESFTNWSGGMTGPNSYQASMSSGTATVAARVGVSFDGEGYHLSGCYTTGTLTNGAGTAVANDHSTGCDATLGFEKVRPGSYRLTTTTTMQWGAAATATADVTVTAG
jgi:hypothetical protein